jgi:hypothetical protein
MARETLIAPIGQKRHGAGDNMAEKTRGID